MQLRTTHATIKQTNQLKLLENVYWLKRLLHITHCTLQMCTKAFILQHKCNSTDLNNRGAQDVILHLQIYI